MLKKYDLKFQDDVYPFLHNIAGIEISSVVSICLFFRYLVFSQSHSFTHFIGSSPVISLNYEDVTRPWHSSKRRKQCCHYLTDRKNDEERN